MAAEKISVTVDAELMKWARSAAKKRRLTLSAVVAEALSMHRQHQAREQFLKEALAGVTAEEIERRTAEAYREIFGSSGAPE
jgi:post-segregation antitoxin (ccd killing protein)